MRTRPAIFMSKVRDNSAPKMILGVCWGARARSLAIPRQAWRCKGTSVYYCKKCNVGLHAEWFELYHCKSSLQSVLMIEKRKLYTKQKSDFPFPFLSLFTILAREPKILRDQIYI